MLIFFIHGTASAIMANNVIARVCHELEQAIERIFPEKMGDEVQRRDASGGQADIPAELAPWSSRFRPQAAGISGPLTVTGCFGLLCRESADPTELAARAIHQQGPRISAHLV